MLLTSEEARNEQKQNLKSHHRSCPTKFKPWTQSAGKFSCSRAARIRAGEAPSEIVPFVFLESSPPPKKNLLLTFLCLSFSYDDDYYYHVYNF